MLDIFQVGNAIRYRSSMVMVEKIEWVGNWDRENNLTGDCRVPVTPNLADIKITQRVTLRGPGSWYIHYFPEKGVSVYRNYDDSFVSLKHSSPNDFELISAEA